MQDKTMAAQKIEMTGRVRVNCPGAAVTCNIVDEEVSLEA